jgi:hypothetical protein
VPSVLKKTETEFDLSQGAAMGRSGDKMMSSSSISESSNVRWDEVVDRTLVQPSIMPAFQRSGDRQDESAKDVSINVQLFGAWASVAVERTQNIIVPKPTTVGAVIAAMGERLGDAFVARVLDDTGAKRRYCRLFVSGVPIDDMRTPIDADSVDIEMILLVAIEGG